LGAQWLFGGLLGGALAGWATAAAAGSSHPWLLGAAIGVVAGALLGNFIATQLMTERLRPYFRRVMEERKDEIASIR
jgi:outer membrane lipoprotein SlyB